MNVQNDGTFRGVIVENMGRVQIQGDIQNNGKRILGSINATGKFGPARGCDGRVLFEARPS